MDPGPEKCLGGEIFLLQPRVFSFGPLKKRRLVRKKGGSSKIGKEKAVGGDDGGSSEKGGEGQGVNIFWGSGGGKKEKIGVKGKMRLKGGETVFGNRPERDKQQFGKNVRSAGGSKPAKNHKDNGHKRGKSSDISENSLIIPKEGRDGT